MKHIWLGIEGTGLRVSAKNALFLTLNIIIAAAIGGLIWAAIGQWMLLVDFGYSHFSDIRQYLLDCSEEYFTFGIMSSHKFY